MFGFLRYIFALLLIPFVSFIWEYVARRKRSNIKPSVALTFVADNLMKLFRKVGSFLAWVSSFYTLINVRELQEAFNDLVKPTINIITSPFHMVVGYVRKMNLYNHPYLIIFGSVTLVSLLGLLGWYFAIYEPFVNFVVSYFNAGLSKANDFLFGSSAVEVVNNVANNVVKEL